LKLKKKKQRGQLCILFGKREKKKKATGNNPTTIHRHAPHHKKEYMVALPKNDGRLCLGTGWRHMRCLNGDDATHLLVHNEHAITAFLNKKVNMKNTKTPC
jgi:hypothetical protein